MKRSIIFSLCIFPLLLQANEYYLTGSTGKLSGQNITTTKQTLKGITYKSYYVVAMHQQQDNALVLTKLNHRKNIVWSKRIDGNYAHKPLIQSNGHNAIYLLANSDGMKLMKFDSNGKMLWAKETSWANSDKAESMQYYNGEILISGITHGVGNGSANPFALSVSTQGKLNWHVVLDRKQNDVNSRMITDGKAYYLAGNTTTNTYGGDDLFLAKLNKQQKLDWYHHFGTEGGEGTHAITFYQNHLYTAGVHTTRNSTKYGQVVKYNMNGKVEKAQLYGATGAENFSQIAAWHDTLVLVGKTNMNGKALSTSLIDQNLGLLSAHYYTNNQGFQPIRPNVVNNGSTFILPSNTTHYGQNGSINWLEMDASGSCNTANLPTNTSHFQLKFKQETVSLLRNKPDHENWSPNISAFSLTKTADCTTSHVGQAMPKAHMDWSYNGSQLHLQFEQIPQHITIMAMNGATLYSSKPESNHLEIPTHQYINGAYVIRAQYRNYSTTEKVLINR